MPGNISKNAASERGFEQVGVLAAIMGDLQRCGRPSGRPVLGNTNRPVMHRAKESWNWLLRVGADVVGAVNKESPETTAKPSIAGLF